MTPRRRSLALALLAAALPLAACAGPRLALDAPDLDPDARAARAKAALTTHAAASERAAAHLELAWLCLLHGQSCAELPRHADAAVAFAPEMTLAQLTRAIGLQGSDDVGARARAWLDLALWAALSADPDARALGPLAVRAAARLAAIDAKATRAVLRDGVVAIDAALAAADPRARHGVRAALDGLLASAEVPMLAAEDSAATALAVRQHRAPLHPRAHIGQSRLEPGWAIALDAEPDAGWLPLVADRRGTLAGRRYRLPSGDLGVFALRVEADVTAGAGDHRALLVDSPRPLRLADGTRLPPGRHLLPAAGAEVVRAASDNGAPQPTPAATPQRLRWTLAISRIARPDAIAFALVALPTNAAAPPPASRPPPAPMATTFARRAIARVVALMTAFERGSADLKAAVADRGALPALLAFDVEGARAPVAVLDRVLDHRDDHLDAAVARAARARDDGQGAVGHGLLAPLLQRLERGDSRIAARADLLLELGWAALGDGLGDLAAAYAERAVAAQPGHCPTLARAFELATLTLERAAVRRLLEHELRCEDQALLRASAARLAGHSDRPELHIAAAHPATRAAAQLRWLEAFGFPLPRRPGERSAPAPAIARQERWHEAQRDLLAGRDAAARATLTAALVEASGTVESRRRAWRMGATPPWAGMTVDGLALARASTATEADGAGMIWLLDQEITVLLPGGGALRRSHQLVRVLSAEVAGALGEVAVPHDAEVELVRTIAPDGGVLGPADTPDKEGITLRGVVPGALVEQIQVQFLGPDDPATGATRLPPFLMGSFDGPTARAEAIVLAGADTTPQLELGAQTPPPRIDRFGPWRRWTFTARDLPRLQREPRANRVERALATVRVSVGAASDPLIDQFEEILAAHLERRDPALTSWVERAVAAGDNPARWQALLSTLGRKVSEREGGSSWPGAPDAAVRDGEGDRAALIWHLAQRAGLDACLLRVSPWSRHPRWQHADPADYGLGAVELPLRGGRVIYDAGVDGGLPDVLRPGLRGRPALRLGCAGRGVIETGRHGDASDRREVDVSLRWAADGSLIAEGEDVLRGVLAVIVRNLIVSGDDDTRAAVLRQLTSASFPNMRASWRQGPGQPAFSGLGSDLEPLRLRWQVVAAPSGLRRAALRLGLSPYRLARTYATLASRHSALRYAHTLDVRLRLRVRSDAGALRLPAAAEVRHGRVRLDRRVGGDAHALTIEHHLQAEMGVVPAADYPAFAAALRAVDAAESLRLERTLPPPAIERR